MTLLAVTSGTWTITFIGWAIVFAALVLLIAVFTSVPKIYHIIVERQLRKEGKLASNETLDNNDISGDTNAAIAMTLHMYLNEQHDEESGVITIKRIQRRYSPWSSKIYGLNNQGFK